MTREGNGFKTHEDMVRLDRLKDLGEGNFISNTVKNKSSIENVSNTPESAIFTPW